MPQLLSPEHRDASEPPSIVLRSEHEPQDLGPAYSSEPQIERRAHQLLASDANKTTGCITEGAAHSTHIYRASHSSPGVNAPRFTYEHLRLNIASFRLVQVLCPADDGTIRCIINNIALDASPLAEMDRALPENLKYTCLSYVWGSSDDTRWIELNGQPFEVRKNLWDFLNIVSHPPWIENKDTFGSLWIDTLCIDQENNEEKNHQVRQMGRIYSRAQMVIAWMGHDPDIRDFLRLYLFYTGASRVRDGRLYDRRHSLLDHFCDHNYWKRAWITQELLLSRELHLFAQETLLPFAKFSLKHLSDMVIREGGIQEKLYSRASSDPLRLIIEGISRAGQPIRLAENLELYGHKLCVDALDLAYYLISVSVDGAKLKVDYTLSPTELARDVLSLEQGKLCIWRAYMVMQTFKVPASPQPGRYASFIFETTTDKLTSLRNVQACPKCGVEYDTLSQQWHSRQLSRLRCVCLQCNHVSRSEFSELHRCASLGHLFLLPVAPHFNNSCNWGLFWTYVGVDCWHKLEGRKQVKVTERGVVRNLKLSVEVIYELMAIIKMEGSQRNDFTHRFHQQTHGSGSLSGWRVTS